MNPNFNFPICASMGSLLLVISGCGKPKPPATEPLVRGELAQEGKGTPVRIQQEDLRRQKLIQEAKEVFQTIYFPLDQAALDGKAKAILSGIHKFTRDNPEITFTVAGHCDERGTVEYNLALGEKRVRAVTAYLADLGIERARMGSISYGEERPAQEGRSEAVWKLNRRAEFDVKYNF